MLYPLISKWVCAYGLYLSSSPVFIALKQTTEPRDAKLIDTALATQNFVPQNTTILFSPLRALWRVRDDYRVPPYNQHYYLFEWLLTSHHLNRRHTCKHRFTHPHTPTLTHVIVSEISQKIAAFADVSCAPWPERSSSTSTSPSALPVVATIDVGISLLVSAV